MEWRRSVDNWLTFAQKLIFPPTCVLCGDTGNGGDLCDPCRAELPRFGPACPACALPVPEEGQWCGACQQHPPPYLTTALFHYAPPLDRLIVDLKFNGRLHLARLLGELGSEIFAQRPRPDRIIPVPLHPTRLRERGYNQALELARVIARKLDVPLSANACTRVRHTPSQANLDQRARRRNLRGAFTVAAEVSGQRVVVVDDVMTTGSTARELATALRRAGAAEVEIWCVARAFRD